MPASECPRSGDDQPRDRVCHQTPGKRLSLELLRAGKRSVGEQRVECDLEAHPDPETRSIARGYLIHHLRSGSTSPLSMIDVGARGLSARKSAKSLDSAAALQRTSLAPSPRAYRSATRNGGDGLRSAAR